MEKHTVDHSAAPVGQIMSVFPEHTQSGESWPLAEPLLEAASPEKDLFIYFGLGNV